VQLSGFAQVPNVGDVLQVFPSAKAAKQRAEELADLHHDERRQKSGGILDIMASLQSGDMKFLKIVLKADAEGSLEAVKQAIEKIEAPEARPKIIHAATGAVTESDVLMASASEGIVIGFHVLLTPRVKRIAEQESVEVQNYTIIYELVDDIRKILEGMLEAEEVETEIGKATVKQVFYTKKKMMIVGCGLTDGKAEQGAMVKIMRMVEGEEGDELTDVGSGKIAVLQHFEKKVKVLEAPTDCGMQFEGKVAIEEGDILVMTKMESKLKTLQVAEGE
jgi:translation initiation factor IF-2